MEPDHSVKDREVAEEWDPAEGASAEEGAVEKASAEEGDARGAARWAAQVRTRGLAQMKIPRI